MKKDKVLRIMLQSHHTIQHRTILIFSPLTSRQIS